MEVDAPESRGLLKEGQPFVHENLLGFAEAPDRKPANPNDVSPHKVPDEELRRVKRRKGRRHLANFENLLATTHVYELSAGRSARRGAGRSSIFRGASSASIMCARSMPARLARATVKTRSSKPRPSRRRLSTKGWPGLLAYIATSRFGDYLPLYRLEDIFARQGFEISRATQSVWWGDVADLVEPLYELMADEVRASHVVATDDTIMPMQSKEKCANARMWVYVGDQAHPYSVFDFTLNRGRDGPKYFLKDTTRCFWPTRTAVTTAWWPATASFAPDAGPI